MKDSSLDQQTLERLLRQVEYFFSDDNLQTDAFLQSCISEGPDGMVDLLLLCTFRRIRRLLMLDQDVQLDQIPENTLKIVVETLRSSPRLRVSEDGKRIGRATEQPRSLTSSLNN